MDTLRIPLQVASTHLYATLRLAALFVCFNEARGGVLGEWRASRERQGVAQRLSSPCSISENIEPQPSNFRERVAAGPPRTAQLKLF